MTTGGEPVARSPKPRLNRSRISSPSLATAPGCTATNAVFHRPRAQRLANAATGTGRGTRAPRFRVAEALVSESRPEATIDRSSHNRRGLSASWLAITRAECADQSRPCCRDGESKRPAGLQRFQELRDSADEGSGLCARGLLEGLWERPLPDGRGSKRFVAKRFVEPRP